PAYSQWLARRHPDRADENLLKTVETLWEASHKLALFLEPGKDEPGKPEIVDFNQLSQGAIKLDKQLAALHEQGKDPGRESMAKTTITAWRDATDALAVPDPATRLGQLTNIRRISRDLLVRTAGAQPRAETPPTKSDGSPAKKDEVLTPGKVERQAQAA